MVGKDFLSPVFYTKLTELEDGFVEKLLLFRNLKPSGSPLFLGTFGCILLSDRSLSKTAGRPLYLVEFSLTECAFTVYSAGSLTLESGNEVYYAVETLGNWTNATAMKAFVQFLRSADPDAYRKAGDLIRSTKTLHPDTYESKRELEFVEELDLADFLR